MIKRVFKYIISMGLMTSLSLIIYATTGPHFNIAPLVSPFTFASDDPQYFKFMADKSETYMVEIYVKRDWSDEKWKAIFGSGPGTGDRGNVEWHLHKGDKIVARGSNIEYRYAPFWTSDYSGLDIGEISVEKGIPYSISLHVKNLNPDWDELEPYIQVKMHPARLEYLIGYFIYGVILLVIFGPMVLTWLLIAISNSRASKIDN